MDLVKSRGWYNIGNFRRMGIKNGFTEFGVGNGLENNTISYLLRVGQALGLVYRILLLIQLILQNYHLKRMDNKR